MKTDKDRRSLYLGKAGEHRVMSEFLARGYNVAVPEVDVGDDVLVVKDEDHTMYRVQVKTSALNLKTSGQFLVPRVQLETPDEPELWYIFLGRGSAGWTQPLIISRQDLFDIQLKRQSKKSKGHLINFKVQFPKAGTAKLGRLSLDHLLDAWLVWPDLQTATVASAAHSDP
jgi:hypothetical protein